MINENQEDVMNAYGSIMNGQVVTEKTELNEELESALVNKMAQGNDAILEAYNAANNAEFEKEKESLLQEAKKHMKEMCDKCDSDPCTCETITEEEMCDKCEKEPCVCEEEVVNESEFQKFMKSRLSEKENADEMDASETLAFFAECEALWEGKKCNEEDDDKDDDKDDEKDDDSKKLDETTKEEMNEEEINSEKEFMEYGMKLLKQAHGDEFDEAKGKSTLEGILKDSDGDFGKAVGVLQASLD
jgi:hypothetical protein